MEENKHFTSLSKNISAAGAARGGGVAVTMPVIKSRREGRSKS